MLDDYLIIHKSILPDYYEAVIKARNMLEQGKVDNITAAAKAVGISRSTYYKYKDFIMEPSDLNGGRKAVLSMMLAHEAGVLSKVLSTISKAGGSVLTITQSLPIKNRASVTISLDVSSIKGNIESLVEKISACTGVENPKLVALE